MHGVPRMPDVEEGRISVVLFFHPNQKQLINQFKTIQEENPSPSEDSGSIGMTSIVPCPAKTIEYVEIEEYRPAVIYLMPDLHPGVLFANMEKWQCGTLWDLICRNPNYGTAAKSRALRYRKLERRPLDSLKFLCSDQGQHFLEDLIQDAPCAVICVSPIDSGTDWRRCDLTKFIALALSQHPVEVRIVHPNGSDHTFSYDDLPD